MVMQRRGLGGTSRARATRTSAWTADKAASPELYAHAAVKTLTAEQLYDSLNRVLSRKPQAMFPGQVAGSPLLDPQRQAFIASTAIDTNMRKSATESSPDGRRRQPGDRGRRN